MKLAELLEILTKYYTVVISDHKGTQVYEDQTAVPTYRCNQEIATCDFCEDDGGGESLIIHLKEGAMLNNRYCSDDITWCVAECVTDCPRQPKYIRDTTIPHSYSDFSKVCMAYEGKEEKR